MIRFLVPLVAFALLVLVFIKGLDPNRNLSLIHISEPTRLQV